MIGGIGMPEISFETEKNIILRMRKKIPEMGGCMPGCHQCCGPVPFSRYEWERIEDKRPMQEGSIDCPYISENGCEIYEERPMLCRLFGPSELGEESETKRMACPNGEVNILNARSSKKAIRTIKRIGQEYADLTKETGVYGPLCDSEIF